MIPVFNRRRSRSVQKRGVPPPRFRPDAKLDASQVVDQRGKRTVRAVGPLLVPLPGSKPRPRVVMPNRPTGAEGRAILARMTKPPRPIRPARFRNVRRVMGGPIAPNPAGILNAVGRAAGSSVFRADTVRGPSPAARIGSEIAKTISGYTGIRARPVRRGMRRGRG